ncbi:hypothetical protein L6R49_15745 [Myxococcota bacterium]|nr:hypothetical protein [Myxococcota bacterium]
MRAALPSLLLSLLVACSGDQDVATAPAEPTPPAEPPAAPPAEDAAVTLAGWTFETRAGKDVDEGTPNTMVVVKSKDGASFEVGPLYGECSQTPVKGTAYALHCWWAGAGSNVEVRSAGGKAEIWKQDLDEGMTTPMAFEKIWAQP